jgi:hypothetical protein
MKMAIYVSPVRIVAAKNCLVESEAHASIITDLAIRQETLFVPFYDTGANGFRFVSSTNLYKILMILLEFL